MDAISGAISTVTGIAPELSTSGGTSDGRFIADICPQVVEMGPRNATIHKLNEYVKEDPQLPQIYRLTLESLLLWINLSSPEFSAGWQSERNLSEPAAKEKDRDSGAPAFHISI